MVTARRLRRDPQVARIRSARTAPSERSGSANSTRDVRAHARIARLDPLARNPRSGRRERRVRAEEIRRQLADERREIGEANALTDEIRDVRVPQRSRIDAGRIVEPRVVRGAQDLRVDALARRRRLAA